MYGFRKNINLLMKNVIDLIKIVWYFIGDYAFLGYIFKNVWFLMKYQYNKVYLFINIKCYGFIRKFHWYNWN